MFDSTSAVDVLERGEMGKKKSQPEEPPKQKIIASYKADVSKADAFKEWLEGLAEHVGAPLTVTIDMALKQFAVDRKYKPVMPKRLGK